MRAQFIGIIPRGVRPRQILCATVASLALSACSTLRGDQQHPDILGDTTAEVNWVDPRNSELEAENEKLRAENEALTQRLAALEASATKPAAAEAPASAGGAAATPEAPPVKPQAVVSAVKVDEAFKGSPAPPVDPAPRLVQPSFASQQETVFENEALGEIQTSSVLFGVHLASYSKTEDAQKGWRKLQRENPDQLGLLEPRVVEAKVEGRGTFVRLIGGGFSSEEKAAQLCASLKGRGVYCRVTGFEGERLSIAESG